MDVLKGPTQLEHDVLHFPFTEAFLSTEKLVHVALLDKIHQQVVLAAFLHVIVDPGLQIDLPHDVGVD